MLISFAESLGVEPLKKAKDCYLRAILATIKLSFPALHPDREEA